MDNGIPPEVRGWRRTFSNGAEVLLEPYGKAAVLDAGGGLRLTGAKRTAAKRNVRFRREAFIGLSGKYHPHNHGLVNGSERPITLREFPNPEQALDFIAAAFDPDAFQLAFYDSVEGDADQVPLDELAAAKRDVVAYFISDEGEADFLAANPPPEWIAMRQQIVAAQADLYGPNWRDSRGSGLS